MHILILLERYIGKTIFSSIIMTLFVLISLSSIIKFVDQLKKTGQGNYDTIGASIYTLLNMPKDIQIFFPMAILIGTLLGLGVLTQRNELMVMQAFGFTYLQISCAIMKTTIPLILIIMIVGEWMVPYGTQMARNYRAQAIYGGSLVSIQRGIWTKDNDNFVHIEHVNKNNELNGVSIYSFDKNSHLQSILYAVSAKFDINKKFWNLSTVVEYNVQNLKKISNIKTVSSIWRTNLTPEKLNLISLSPDVLSISDLYRYVQYLKENGQNSQWYQLHMWSKIFQPFSIIAMVFTALSCFFGILRYLTIGVRIITSISIGFMFYIFNQIIESIIIIYRISPIIGALLPSIIFFLISIKLLFKCF